MWTSDRPLVTENNICKNILKLNGQVPGETPREYFVLPGVRGGSQRGFRPLASQVIGGTFPPLARQVLGGRPPPPPPPV